MNNENKQDQQIQVKITDEILKGVYANTMQVSHTPDEFVLDFMNIFPASGVGIVTSKVIVSPAHYKRVLAAMQQNLKLFEDKFGTIKHVDTPEPKIGFRAE
ncbi:MAG: DUF3467 domain-containing protein [Patescibacteria group bacterium]